MNKTKNKLNKLYLDRVIVNRVRLYKTRSTVQSQTITGTCCAHGNWINTVMMTNAYLMWKPVSLVNLIYTVFVSD